MVALIPAPLPHPAYSHLLLNEKGNGKFINLERGDDSTALTSIKNNQNLISARRLRFRGWGVSDKTKDC
jgi:hypothetical protein